jgi:hypothetical protein
MSFEIKWRQKAPLSLKVCNRYSLSQDSIAWVKDKEVSPRYTLCLSFEPATLSAFPDIT